MPDAARVLNATYDWEPTGTTYHEYHRARLADGSAQPLVVIGAG